MARRTGSRKAGGGVIVTGDVELDKKLSQMEQKIQKKVARQSMRKAVKEIIVPAAKAKVNKRSGALGRSIKARAMKRSRSRVGVEARAGEGHFKGDQYYSGMLEFGTKKMRARPFLRPAGYENKERIERLIIKDLRRIIVEMAE